MRHAPIFLYLLSLFVGMASLAATWAVFRKTRSSLVMSQGLFSLSFFLVIFSYLFLLSYINQNVPEVVFGALVLVLALTLAATGFLLFSLLHFTRALVIETPTKAGNIAAATASLLTVVLLGMSIEWSGATGTVSQKSGPWLYLGLAVFGGGVLYAVVLKAIRLKRLQGARRWISKTMLALDALFLPGVALDLYLYQSRGFVAFMPIFYCAFSCLVSFRLLWPYLPAGGHSPESNLAGNAFLREAGISNRERQIIEALLKGNSNKRIADDLHISPNTVKTHLKNIFQKLEVGSRLELASVVNRHRSDQTESTPFG